MEGINVKQCRRYKIRNGGNNVRQVDVLKLETEENNVKLGRRSKIRNGGKQCKTKTTFHNTKQGKTIKKNQVDDQKIDTEKNKVKLFRFLKLEMEETM